MAMKKGEIQLTVSATWKFLAVMNLCLRVWWEDLVGSIFEEKDSNELFIEHLYRT